MSTIIIQGSFPGGKPHHAVIIQAKDSTSGNNTFPLIKNKKISSLYVIQQHSSSATSGVYKLDTARLNLKDNGSPLPTGVREKMESVFKSDFSNVRIHTGPQAESIGALAFTTGNDIYFAQGQYNPSSSQGQRLIGHELTHVVQQKKGRVRNPLGSGVAVVHDPGLEAEAERMGIRAASVNPGRQQLIQSKLVMMHKLKNILNSKTPSTRRGSNKIIQPAFKLFNKTYQTDGSDGETAKTDLIELVDSSYVGDEYRPTNDDIFNLVTSNTNWGFEYVSAGEDGSHFLVTIEGESFKFEYKDRAVIFLIDTVRGTDFGWVSTNRTPRVRASPLVRRQRNLDHNIDSIETKLRDSIGRFPVYTLSENAGRAGCVKFGPDYTVDPSDLRYDVYQHFNALEGTAFAGYTIHIVNKAAPREYNITLHGDYNASNPKTAVNLHVN